MRIGATVLLETMTAVQSYNWNCIRPLGNLQLVLDSLEEYRTDEVAIIRPVRGYDTLKSFSQDVELLRCIKTMTPLSFGGGIRNLQHIELLKGLPVERLIFSTAFLNEDKKLIDTAANLFGMQAIQCILPFKYSNGRLEVFNSAMGVFAPFTSCNSAFIDAHSNEIILYDVNGEGQPNAFACSVLDEVPFKKAKIIISGGIGKNSISSALKNNIASVLIEYRILHSEYSVKGYKNV